MALTLGHIDKELFMINVDASHTQETKPISKWLRDKVILFNRVLEFNYTTNTGLVNSRAGLNVNLNKFKRNSIEESLKN